MARQGLTLHFYELLLFRNLATETEIQNLKKSRQEFDERLSKPDKTLRDYGEYIAFETNKFSQLLESEKQLYPSDYVNKHLGKATTIMAKYLKNIYIEALELHSDYIKLWNSYINYLKRCGYFSDIDETLDKMLKFNYFTKEISLWIRAIKFNFYHQNNMKKTEDLLVKAMALHSGSIDIHDEFVNILLQLTIKINVDDYMNFTKKLWYLYFNSTFEIKFKDSEERKQYQSKLIKAFNTTIDAGLIFEEKDFHDCLYILSKTDGRIRRLETVEERCTILVKATRAYPRSVKLYLTWIELYIDLDDVVKINEIFRKAIDAIEITWKTISLWNVVLSYYEIHNNYDKETEELFKQAVRKTSPKFVKFRVQYLEWTILVKDIASARDIYDKMVVLRPSHFEMHSKMLEIEFSMLNLNIERIRKIHEDIVKLFGREKIEPWFEYLKFEKQYNSEHYGTRANEIVERAKRVKRGDYLAEFTKEYEIFSKQILYDD